MPKYMKDSKFKKPREKTFEEREPKFHHKKIKESKPKSDHKHEYEMCVIKEQNGVYTFLSLGRRCKHCKRYKADKFLFESEIPEEYKDLPVIDKE